MSDLFDDGGEIDFGALTPTAPTDATTWTAHDTSAHTTSSISELIRGYEQQVGNDWLEQARKPDPHA